MRVVRLVIRAKLAAQTLGLAPRADVYVGCAGGWRYPGYLLRALGLCGLRRVEVREEDAVLTWAAVGFRSFLLRTRLVRAGGRVTAPVVVDRDPSTVPGARRARVTVSVDWFSGDARASGVVMPYFVHPALRDLERELPRLASSTRPFRVGFAGTINDEAYREAFVFPTLTRSDVFDEVLDRFRERIAFVPGAAGLGAVDVASTPIVLVAVRDPADTTSKHVLAGREYLSFLGRCAFFLAPPGYRMPLCHNLVEGMSVGAVPILDYGELLPEPLVDGVDCLAFSTRAELATAVERALAMDDEEIARLREGVRRYCAEHLSVESFARRLCPELERDPTVVVNAERETSALAAERRKGSIDGAAS